MKRTGILCLFCLAVCSLQLPAQEKFGLRNSPWAAIHSSASNPANLVGAWASAQVNLFSVDVYGQTDAFTFSSVKDMVSGIYHHDLKGVVDYEHPLNGAQMDFSMDASLLNVLISGERSAVGFGARLHNQIMARNAGMALVSGIVDGVCTDDPAAQLSSSLGNLQVYGDMYAELYLSLARRFVAAPHHRLDLGVTLRHLSGLYAMRGTIEASDAHWDRSAGLIQVKSTEGWAVHGDESLMGTVRDLSLNSFLNGGNGKGFGLDAGLSYEFHREKQAAYMFKLGVSVKNIGKIKYKDGLTRYDVHVHTPATFRTDTDFGADPDMEDVLNSLRDHYTAIGEVTTRPEPLTFKLPATLHVAFDWHVIAPLFMAANVVLPVSDEEDAPSVTGQLWNVTPRIDLGPVVFSVPVTYWERYGRVSAGAAFTLGHFFIGTDDIMGVVSHEIHGINCYLGYTVNLGKAARIVY